MSQLKCKYQDKNSTMTLREGIEEYYLSNPHLLFPSTLDGEAAEFFKCHDRIHVVFGCNTSFLHEVRADFWTFFGTDIGILKYASYIKHPALKSLMADMKEKVSKDPNFRTRLKKDFKSSLRLSLAAPLQIFLRTRKMHKRWPWFQSESLLERPIHEIRKEYGIDIF